MKTILAAIAWVWAIIFGCMLILFPAGGGQPVRDCWACGGALTTAIAVISILIGVVGFITLAGRKKLTLK
ncbi:MAG: hypothetical protein A2W25_03055 [candidate division Zixibacteria bacterium RBG_16_53_22]|nr:MAG: hypothetical protein A2W25_03055 [candidate division Zixibacteria bacterium RBG_16_53_22]